MNTDHKSNGNSQEATAIASTRPVMLALYTFKHSDKAIEAAIEKAGNRKGLVIVYLSNNNLNKYFVGTDIGFFPDWKEECQKELIQKLERNYRERVEAIAAGAREKGLHVVTYVSAICDTSLWLEIIEKEKPFLIVTTRTGRPAWIRKLFDSKAIHLFSGVDCPVMDV
jgi:isocitrate dehydrogenase